ncbi:hypothetical protein ES288_D08G216800v1 [Gossypium darwinii]|uniref:Uncharacterized protein n=1 Tax=Gossypium darwinii TaxID=34276 RepID=A0A5D2BM15_GOSDA|nr:hypothetical protein ES288_D08G216800v1 [Gossypium darwinii]
MKRADPSLGPGHRAEQSANLCPVSSYPPLLAQKPLPNSNHGEGDKDSTAKNEGTSYSVRGRGAYRVVDVEAWHVVVAHVRWKALVAATL